jgi:dephospho-CoA kinase
MIVLGLTGGVGMGKSTTDSLLRQRGIPVADTDLLARQLVEPGQPALAEIRETFGPDVIGSDGQLRRRELARLVFSDPAARRQLEAILHPRIRELWRACIESDRADGRPIAVVVIPLLFETCAEEDLDATICVACSPATQRQRLLARGWSPEQIEQRIRAQWPIEKKIAHADYVIWTEAGMDVHGEQLDRILARCNPTLRSL